MWWDCGRGRREKDKREKRDKRKKKIKEGKKEKASLKKNWVLTFKLTALIE